MKFKDFILESKSNIIPLKLEKEINEIGLQVMIVVENGAKSHFRYLKIRKTDDRDNLEWYVLYQYNDGYGYYFDKKKVEIDLDDNVENAIDNLPKKIVDRKHIIEVIETLYSELTCN